MDSWHIGLTQRSCEIDISMFKLELPLLSMISCKPDVHSSHSSPLTRAICKTRAGKVHIKRKHILPLTPAKFCPDSPPRQTSRLLKRLTNKLLNFDSTIQRCSSGYTHCSESISSCLKESMLMFCHCQRDCKLMPSLNSWRTYLSTPGIFTITCLSLLILSMR